MKYSIICFTALALLVGCGGAKVGTNLSESTTHNRSLASTQQEFVWEGDCSPCAEGAKNEWSTTCSGKLVGQTGAYLLDEFTATFRGEERNVCKVPRYQALKLKSSNVGLPGDLPQTISLKLSAVACNCKRPEPHHVECTPSFTLNYLGERGLQIGQQDFTGFTANTYCMGDSGPKPCGADKDAKVYNRCMEQSFGLFKALASQTLHH